MKTAVNEIPLSQLLERCHELELEWCNRGTAEPIITALTDDSREVTTGVLFALNTQGADFIDDALKRNCSVVLLQPEVLPILEERMAVQFNSASSQPEILLVADIALALGELSAAFYNHPSRDLYLVGVTGTNGKTTVAAMLAHLWRGNGIVAGTIGTLGASWNTEQGEHVLINTGYTTPRAFQLQGLLRQMADDGVTHVALEASSEGIAFGRIYGCSFSVAVFTNLSPEHLNFHKTMEDYFREKRRLFEMTLNSGGRLVVAEVDEYGRKLAEEYASGDPRRIETLQEPPELEVNPPVWFQRLNAGLALWAAFEQSDPRRESANLLQEMPEVPGRFNLIEAKKRDIRGIVDFAHTPAALENLLSGAREMGGDYLVCVFGCGGERDRQKRPEMGRVAARHADLVIITDDNPRGEEPGEIRKSIVEGARHAGPRDLIQESTESLASDRVAAGPAEIIEIADRREAIIEAVRRATAFSGLALVVVAGKGHEEYQIQNNKKIPFSDRTELELALKS